MIRGKMAVGFSPAFHGQQRAEPSFALLQLVGWNSCSKVGTVPTFELTFWRSGGWVLGAMKGPEIWHSPRQLSSLSGVAALK